MLGVNVEIARYVDDSFPGFFECRLTDADGREWLFVEKVPVVTLAHLDARSNYPQPGIIACHVVESRQDPGGRQVITIDTNMPWHVEATSGATRFEVLASQVVEFDWGWRPGAQV